MSRLFSFLSFLLVPLFALAQQTPAEAPVEPTNTIGVVLFLVLFIGSIVGFIAYVWWNGRKKSAGESA